MIMSDAALVGKLRCVACGNAPVRYEGVDKIVCEACGHAYLKRNGVWDLIRLTDDSQTRIQEFWDDLCRQLYAGHEELTAERLSFLLDELKVLLKNFEQPLGQEIDLNALKGLDVLEIGCGAGAHSSLMKKAGARIVSMDLTPSRVVATQAKLALLKEGEGMAVGGNAERLPFRDEAFDLVYSFGVLHHTTDTEAAIKEVHRVLRPRGRAVVMLYAKRSFYYYVNLLLLKGLLMGGLLRGRDWIGPVTEGKPKFGTVPNPHTRCYTRGELREMFAAFSRVDIRQNAFAFGQVPKLGALIEHWMVRRGLCTENEGGRLIWDKPLRTLLPIEVKLGRVMGFGYDIDAVK